MRAARLPFTRKLAFDLLYRAAFPLPEAYFSQLWHNFYLVPFCPRGQFGSVFRSYQIAAIDPRKSGGSPSLSPPEGLHNASCAERLVQLADEPPRAGESISPCLSK